MRVGADGHGPATELAEAARRSPGAGYVSLDGVAQAAGVDLERRAALDERAQDRLVQLRRGREVGRRDVRVEVALDEVEVADGVEQPGPGSRLDLVEVRARRSRRSDRPATQRGDAAAAYGEST